MNTDIGATQYDIKQNAFSGIIKIVGVGGCGGNAVNNMHASQMIDGVSYLLINTDQQDLDKSHVHHKLTIGPTTTKGEGAGNDPSRSIVAAQESKQEIVQALKEGNTRMVFVIAGLGGGTGTGAGPLVCQYAKEEGLLVVGVVTLPWAYEGEVKRHKAIEALLQVKQNVDALLIINNQKISEYYSDLPVTLAKKAADDEILGSIKSISDMVTNSDNENVDFADIRHTLENGGIAIIKSGYAQGEGRIEEAVEQALNTPIMNGFNIEESTRIIIYITSSPVNELTEGERSRLANLTTRLKHRFSFIQGYARDKHLEDGQIRVSILATGFDFLDSDETEIRTISELSRREEQKKQKDLEEKEELFYGEDIRKLRPHDSSHFLLNIADLENTALLEALAEMPTYLRRDRDYEKLEKIRERTSPPTATAHHSLQSAKGSTSKSTPTGATVIKGFDQ